VRATALRAVQPDEHTPLQVMLVKVIEHGTQNKHEVWGTLQGGRWGLGGEVW
jgi:hypothetical protein